MVVVREPLEDRSAGHSDPRQLNRGLRLTLVERLQELGAMTHAEHIRSFCGTDLDLVSHAGAETTLAGSRSIRGFSVDGDDLTASKLYSLATEDAIQAVGNDDHPSICDGHFSSDLAPAFEQVAGTAVSNALAGRYTSISKPEPHGRSLLPIVWLRFEVTLVAGITRRAQRSLYPDARSCCGNQDHLQLMPLLAVIVTAGRSVTGQLDVGLERTAGNRHFDFAVSA